MQQVYRIFGLQANAVEWMLPSSENLKNVWKPKPKMIALDLDDTTLINRSKVRTYLDFPEIVLVVQCSFIQV